MSVTIIKLVDTISGYERYGISRDGEVYDFEKERFISVCVNGNGYLFVNLYDDTGNRRSVKVHRLLAITYLPNPENLPYVDHLDRDKKNNSLSNLRWCSISQNGMNQSLQIGNKSSKFKGVSWHKKNCKWEASIRINGRRKYLGSFEKEEDAALAYNLAALELFGEFANLNIIDKSF